MDDAQLVALARAGEEAAVEELFGRVWPLAWHWAYGVTGERMLADHVAQDAILRAFGALDRFDPARPFRPWLKRITVNLAIDELRRERRHARTGEWMSELRPVAPFDDDPELLESLVDAVRDLPERQRLVVVLHYWLDTGVEEISTLLEIPVGTVVSRLSRARAALRERLEVADG
ncbi:MAG: RNA polymerase sigma factor [Actinobacteria bacterium]|nr:MAG: RNA polymerase sigma factor [Actinomycetota bacterium]